MNIEELLKEAIQELKNNNIEDANLKAKILLANELDKSKEYLIVNSKQKVEEKNIQQLKIKVQRLIDGTPLQYITKKQEFMGLKFYVDENVLIPQPDTEILVENAINQINKEIKKIKILELCTGSGCIAISLAKYIENIEIVAIDISEEALKIAKKNAKNNEVEEKIQFLKSDMFENINQEFDIIVSNPPYIETQVIKTLSKEVQNEPIIALDGGKDGLEFYKIIAKESYKYLNSNGYIMVEIGYNQRKNVINLFENTKQYKEIVAIKDLGLNDRIIIAKRV